MENYNECTEYVEPLISVIIPVYNTEKYLGRCLDSIITNTYKSLEIICVDDGSTDNSMKILKYYAKKDSRIKVFEQKQKGPSAARNLALDNATGEFVSFVDSDDFVSWNAYEIMKGVAEVNNLDLLMFGANAFPEAETPDWIRGILDTKYRHYQNCDGCKVVLEERAARPFLWLHFVKRALFEYPTKLRFDENMTLGEDQLLQFQYVPRAKNVMVIEDKLYNYRIARSGSLMQLYASRINQKVETHLELVQKVADAWKKQGIFETNEDLLLTWMVNFLYYSIFEMSATFKKKYTEDIIKLFEKNKFQTFLIAEWEQHHLEEIKEWAKVEQCDDVHEIENLKKMIEQEKYEIEETLKSRAFKFGRILTRKKERIAINNL